MADHIAALSRSCFFYIRQLRSIRKSLTTDAMKTLVYAFVSSRIDYCNSWCQRSTATEAAISPECSCTSGHWSQEIRSHDAYSTTTALATSTPANYFSRQPCWYTKCRHGMAPPYLSTYCEPTSSHGGWCHLRSAESSQLTVPRTRTNYGDRSFAIHGPVVWNSLPADLCLLNISLPVFRKRLKMFLF